MKIAVVGLGRLGFPVASAFAHWGFGVVGVDTNERLIASLADGQIDTTEPDVKRNMGLALKAPKDCDAAFICVQTPSKSDGAFDDSFVRDAISNLPKVPLIVVVSTLMPKQSRSLIKDGSLFCYSPTFIALGSVVQDFLHPDFRLIGEASKESGDALEAIYAKLPEAPVVRMSLESAEIAKLAVNCFVTTKIAFANQLQLLCEETPNADVDDVTRAMGKDNRIGRRCLKAGMPYGGPCFPRDNAALTAAGFINSENWYHAYKLANMIPGGKVLVLGSAYKVGTEVIDHSPSKALAHFARAWLSDSVEHIVAAEIVVFGTPDPRWLQADYREKIIFDPWGFAKDHGLACKQLISPGRR